MGYRLGYQQYRTAVLDMRVKRKRQSVQIVAGTV